jgi:hypothetical protein
MRFTNSKAENILSNEEGRIRFYQLSPLYHRFQGIFVDDDSPKPKVVRTGQ